MEAIKVTGHIGEDGVLRIEYPTRLVNRNLQVLLVLPDVEAIETDELGWRIGYFDETYASLSDDPIERPEQLPIETRDTLE